MALEGCGACLKYIMIIWNFIIMVLGIGILGMGVWMVVDKDSGKFVDEHLDDNSPFVINYSQAAEPSVFETLAYILIVFGAITVVIAFLGYCGAMRESQCLLGSCFILLFVIFAALVGVGIYMYIEKDNINVDDERLEPYLRKMMVDAVEKYGDDPQSKSFMDTIEEKYDCCGVDGVMDYKLGSPSVYCSKLTNIMAVNNGCFEPYYKHVSENIGVNQFFSEKMTMAMAVALGVAGSLVLAMIFTLILCCQVRRSGSY